MSNPTTNLDDIRVFTKVVEAGSFTKAASLLAMPKSTVSRRVSELEDALGVRLIQRTTRKLHLTDEGQLYFNQTSRLLEELEHTEVALSSMQGSPRGLLRITTPGDIGATMSHLVAQFQQQYPLVDVLVFATGRRVDLVAEGYDVALRAGDLSDSTLVSKTIFRTCKSVFASPRYLERHPPIENPLQLSDHQCIIFSNERLEATWRLYGPSGPVDIPVKGRVGSGDFSFLRGAVLNGQGIALLPHLVGDTHEAAGELVRLLPDYRSDESSFYAVYPSARNLSPKVRAFIDFASNYLQQNPLL